MLKLARCFKYIRPAWSHSALTQVNENIYDSLYDGAFDTKFRDVATSVCDGSGKQYRPLLILMLARLLNGEANENQIKVAMATEMMHTASLVHDDIVDDSEIRRGKPTIGVLYGDNYATQVGNYIMGQSKSIIASTNNTDVIHNMSNAMMDLVHGEFVQIKNINIIPSLEIYIEKSFLKTGSLYANSFKSVANLYQPENTILSDEMYTVGKNIGIAFQIIDDCLDFTSTGEVMGKPSKGADLKIGQITSPVLYALETDHQIQQYIRDGDVDRIIKSVADHRGAEKAKELAAGYVTDALQTLSTTVTTNSAKSSLSDFSEILNDLISRDK